MYNKADHRSRPKVWGFFVFCLFNWELQVGSWQLKWERAGLGDPWPDAGGGELEDGGGALLFLSQPGRRFSPPPPEGALKIVR